VGYIELDKCGDVTAVPYNGDNGEGTDIGRKWIGSIEHRIFGIGVICAFFHWLGTVDCDIDALYNNANSFAMNGFIDEPRGYSVKAGSFCFKLHYCHGCHEGVSAC